MVDITSSEGNNGLEIIIIGDVNIDIITPPFDPSVLIEGESSCVLDYFTMSLGGNAINAAAAIAALRGRHLFIGALGTCAISSWIINKCKELEINTEISILEGKSAGITMALTYNNGKRQFIATIGTNGLLSTENFPKQLKTKLKNKIHLHRAGFWYTPKLKGKPTIDLFKEVLKTGGETSLDVGWDPENYHERNRKIILETLKYTTYFFANDKEIQAIANVKEADKAYETLINEMTEANNPMLVVHQGEKGCSLVSKNGIEKIKPVSVREVINPTGSGDVFNGAFMFGLQNGWSPSKSAHFAGEIAAIHLQDLEKIYPTIHDLEEYRKNKNRRK